jgi:DNA polymerase III epsilon subunit-like protein
MPMEMKPYAGMHPRALASLKPKDRPKQEAPKIDPQAPSLKMMRDTIVKKKPADKEVAKYFEEVIERLVEARERDDDGES